MPLVTVVRPYAPRIRTRVFELMRRAGCTILPENVVPAGTSDAVAVQAVLERDNLVLLVPFHGHHDAQGNRVDGLGFLQQLDKSGRGEHQWRVIMPVSAFAVSAVTAILARGDVPDRIRRWIMMITEDELDAPETADRIRAHVNS